MNTNRISTDIKHAKEALEKKLDSLQVGMDGIPNLLTPSFDSIKNVLASITTKVDNVRGGVDLNHTALTDLQQRLTAVEGSVGQVQQDVGKVQTGLVGVNNNVANVGLPKDLKIFYLQGASTLLSVTGKGRLYCVGANTSGSSADSNLNYMEIYIDGKKICKMYRQQEESGCYVCSKLNKTPLQHAGAYESISSRRMFLPIGVINTPNISSPQSFMTEVLSENSTASTDTSKKIFYQSIEPLEFKKSLKITNSNDVSVDRFLIAYTLDE